MMPRRALLLRPFGTVSVTSAAAASFSLFVGAIHVSNGQDITSTPEPTAGTVETAAPTSSIPFGPTPEPTEDDTNNKEYPTTGVSCKDFTLEDGVTTIDIDSRSACFEACNDHYNGGLGERYFPSYGYDHGENIDYEYFYSNDRTRMIGLFAECYCRNGRWKYEPKSTYICGKTRFGEALLAPEEPLPKCTDMNIHGSSDCSSRCVSMYSVNSWDSYWPRYYQYGECICTLGDDLSVRICTDLFRNSGSSYNDDDYSSLPGGIIAAMIGLLVVGICAFLQKSSDNEARRQGRNPDPALSEFRQQQQRRQQTSVQTQLSPPQLSAEEQQRIRRGIVKSNLLSRTLTKGGDVEFLASITASRVGRSDGRGDVLGRIDGDNNKEQGEEGEPTTTPGSGILDTLRSAVSSIPTLGSAGDTKPECSICLMAYESGETVAWANEEECHHMYHEDCIIGWLSTPKRDGTLHDSCPLCRTKLIVDEAEA